MGALIYDTTGPPITIDDRALSHLKVVIIAKLRRQESFSVSWRHPEGQDGGRTTIWLNPSMAIRFVFDDPHPPELNRRWLAEMAESANMLGGVTLSEEQVLPE
ncbi:DUF7882 family protein [Microbacterium album]|uniref:DUF7882 domain-containing protein n=1 Tax=Microbacterium album TaxID=2053191 RepID=A0A917ID71_9MICO|nr:hypothetical protein [Microbacterium album]GGH36439.1 hypothetical protein GCM10010921_05590 [Microbacterium album]